MNLQIRPFKNSDIDDLVTLTLLAFEPIFISFEKNPWITHLFDHLS